MTDRPIPVADEADDERYLETLRSAGRLVPDDSVDWDAFHVRLAARAQLPLARLRYPHLTVESEAERPVRELPLHATRATHWWEHAARWSRLTVSASVAAGIVLVMIVRTSPKDTADKESTDIVATNVAVTTTDQVDGTRADFESAVVGHAGTWTIDSALMPSATDLLIPLGSGGATR